MKIVRIHIIAATLALLMIGLLMLLAIGSEIVPDHLASVRRWIARGLFVLVPALIVTGITGHRLARGYRRGLVGDKIGRMKIVAFNGIFILLPCALWLASRAETLDIGAVFRVVQGIELVAGATNLVLLGLNFRDGMRLSGRLRRGVTAVPSVIRRA